MFYAQYAWGMFYKSLAYQLDIEKLAISYINNNKDFVNVYKSFTLLPVLIFKPVLTFSTRKNERHILPMEFHLRN